MKEVYLVDAVRTPQAKAGADLSEVEAPFLGDYLIRHLQQKHNIPNDQIDEVIVGNTGTPAKYPNIGRVVALEAGLDAKTSGYSVHRNCASGLEAVSQAFNKIQGERGDLYYAGGVENMTLMPLIYGKKMTDFFFGMMKAKTPADKLKIVTSFRPSFLKPIVAVEQGLTDPFCGMNMGMTAEVLAREFNITREQQDEYANESHRRAVTAQKSGAFSDEIVPIITGKDLSKRLTEDVGPRAQSTLEKLAKLKPYFDRKTGSVTVGNACPLTDGGSMCLMASEEGIKKHNLKPLAKVINFHFHGLEPERMGLGPVLAMDGVLKRANMTLDQMDLIEINEAFAAQVLACIKMAKEDEFASRWGIKAIGEISLDKLNVNGGAIALGHPVGSTGSRLVTTLAHALKKQNKRYGIASLCIGGGQGGAIILENLSYKG